MAAFASVKAQWNKTVRLARRLCARLRRQRAVVALAITVALGLGEPVVCILHCQLWLPFAFQSYFAAQHQHEHHQHMHSGGTSAAREPAFAASSDLVTQPGAPAQSCAFQSGQNNNVPFHVPPSPVHEMLPAFGVLLLAIGLLREHLTDPPNRPPAGSRRQILRPPVLSLGR